MLKNNGKIIIHGARVHNLKNFNVELPSKQIIVITGLSGSGKSSLAFDTLFAEGQRRYMESLSAYARQFIGNMTRPDVDKITGIGPVIAIEQKSNINNPRSTVGTITEIYDYLRLLYARASTAYSINTGEKMIKYTEDQILNIICSDFNNKAIYILSPVVEGRKGHYKDLFAYYRKKGFIQARIDGEVREMTQNMSLDRYKTHFIEIVIDKLIITDKDKSRIKKSVSLAIKYGKGLIMITEKDTTKTRFFSKNLICPSTGLSYRDPAPYTFSFNSPQGACPKCKGLGYIIDIDIDKIIPDKTKSIYEGGISIIGKYKHNLIFAILEQISDKLNFSLKTPINELTEEQLDTILWGYPDNLQLKNPFLGSRNTYTITFSGVINQLKKEQEEDDDIVSKKTKNNIYNKTIICPKCSGTRLTEEALHFKFANKNIHELSTMSIEDLYNFIDNLNLTLSAREQQISSEILKEVKQRLSFLLDVGLDYLSLSRTSSSLSGGETQRIRLATQIGSKLVNVTYILDEPSIGLHQRDNIKLINSLKNLRDRGNTIIIVEHDKDTILNADYIVDVGPGAGFQGGELLFAGIPSQLLKANTLTAKYLNNKLTIPIPQRRVRTEKSINIIGASGNNLKNIDVEIPLGLMVCITGVSGSGKSSLFNETLVPILGQHFYKSRTQALAYRDIKGLEHINKYIEVNQNPIGRTPRSNPATYTNIFSDIRDLYASLPESKMRGYTAGRFSFNIKGGRCETCKGAGLRTIEMNFLPNVYVNCEDCNGKRYNQETLEIKFKDKSIADILELTINEAVELFENINYIHTKLLVLQDVGLGYIKLGQSSTSLSGGEAQRIKLASELIRKDTGKTLYILDEPTTGLHFHDIKILLQVLNSLIDKGNSMIIIEHNMDIIKSSDWIIDLGPDSGKRGGTILATGTPEEICKNKNSYTGQYLQKELKTN